MNNKQILPLKDILKYYIGQPMNLYVKEQRTPLKCKLVGYKVQEDGTPKIAFTCGDSPIEDWAELSEVKFHLLLKRIESIDNKDAAYVIKQFSLDSVSLAARKQFAINIVRRHSSNLHVTEYLLSKGYDLFGAIENGDALDIDINKILNSNHGKD